MALSTESDSSHESLRIVLSREVLKRNALLVSSLPSFSPKQELSRLLSFKHILAVVSVIFLYLRAEAVVSRCDLLIPLTPKENIFKE
jgi:hypothetical protein